MERLLPFLIAGAFIGIYLPGGVPVCHLYNIVHKEELTNGTWWRGWILRL